MKIINGVADTRSTLLDRDFTKINASPGLQNKLRTVFDRDITPEEAISEILREVQSNGDQALIKFTNRFDNIQITQIDVTPSEIADAYDAIDSSLLEALNIAADRIRAFHNRQEIKGWFDTSEGLGQAIRPINRVGLYVPGGSASYPSTVLMSAIPANIAGVKEIVVATPAQEGGDIHPATLVACDIAGVNTIYRIGGPHAIAALAYGTDTIQAVDKICGPGNVLVQLAKKSVFGIVGIDTIQGPSESIVIADEHANPVYCAADLLAQAEHSEDACPIFLTTSKDIAQQVLEQTESALQELPENSPAHLSLERNGVIGILDTFDEIVELANEYAPEHLCLSVKNPMEVADKFLNAGGIFLGEKSPEVLGDYTAGPSHIMPTSRAARFASPLNVLDFVKITSLVGIPEHILSEIGAAAKRIGDSEGLPAHAHAAETRLLEN
ncbi:MAG: histidinol dehydrogenase [SAR202 cluster bacterium]|nr:histidinol dehydrogenase [SAR202 cluster bacterium]|tara:strand:+ start:464 stop:1783 length:1320 start_codon:yes stop_codon:yes gene_type:complete